MNEIDFHHIQSIFFLIVNLSIPFEIIIEASTPSPEVPLINPKHVYSLLIFVFIYIKYCIIVIQ